MVSAHTPKSLFLAAVCALSFIAVSATADAGVRRVKPAPELNPLAVDFTVRESEALDISRPIKSGFSVLSRVVAAVGSILGEVCDTDGVKERLMRPGSPTQRH